jgi:hypothetical protein
MDMSLDQPSPIKRFWRTWRRELVRGGVLFGLVVGVGLFVRSIRVNVPHIPGALGSFGDFDWGDGEGGNLFGHGRSTGDEWKYHAAIKPSQRVWIRNTNGPIEVMPGDGEMVEVHAEKSWRKSSPGSVELIAVPSAGGVTICALWEAREKRCGEDGDYRMNGVRKNDVAVRFMVMLPRGVPVDAQTVNGALEINGVSAPVEATTVNGRINVMTDVGPVNATTVNGSIAAMMHELTGGDIKLTTVNGSVTAGLPRRINANIDAETVNGRVETEFAVKINGKMSSRHLRGVIGNGGLTLRLTTVNGSINLHEADGEMRGMHPVIAPVKPQPPQEPQAPQAPEVRARAKAKAHAQTPPPDQP